MNLEYHVQPAASKNIDSGPHCLPPAASCQRGQVLPSFIQGDCGPQTPAVSAEVSLQCTAQCTRSPVCVTESVLSTAISLTVFRLYMQYIRQTRLVCHSAPAYQPGRNVVGAAVA